MNKSYFFMLKFIQETRRENNMKESYTSQFSAILMTMANINDNLRKSNEILEQLNKKVQSFEKENEKTITHIVHFEKTKKKERDNERF